MGLFSIFRRKWRSILPSSAEKQSAQPLPRYPEPTRTLVGDDPERNLPRPEMEKRSLQDWTADLGELKEELDRRAETLDRREADLVRRETSLPREAPATALPELHEILRSVQVRAENGDTVAQHVLGLLHAHGAGVNRSSFLANQWLTRAAGALDRPAQLTLGLLLLNGQLMQRGKKQSALWLEAAAAAGEPLAHQVLRDDTKCEIAAGKIVSPSTAKVENPLPGEAAGSDESELSITFRPTDDMRYAAACRHLRSPETRQSGLSRLTVLADHGHAPSQWKLAQILLGGQLVSPAAERAATYLLALAKHKHLEAQYTLGKLYADGYLDDGDFKEARRWLGRAANQGHEAAKRELPTLPKPTKFVPRNPDRKVDFSDPEQNAEPEPARNDPYFIRGLRRGLACRHSAIGTIKGRRDYPDGIYDLEAEIRAVARSIARNSGLVDAQNLFGADRIIPTGPHYHQNCQIFVRGVEQGIIDENEE